MRIANIMLARGLGGIEQSFFDYTAGLQAAGHEIAAITHPKAAINAPISALNVSHVSLANFAQWDPSVPLRLRALLRTLRADVVICFDPLALTLARKSLDHDRPLIAAFSGIPCAWAVQADAAFAPSEALSDVLAEAGMAREHIHHVPPMIDQRGGFIRPVWRQPPTILVQMPPEEMKGLRLFLQALSLVAERGIECRAQIMGEGVRLLPLKYHARSLGVLPQISFVAPEAMSTDFLHKVDLFCYPAQLASDGRALLPAMASKLPIVATDAIGPSGMLQHGEEAWIVPAGDAAALAEGLVCLLEDEDRARTLASNAFHRLKRHHVRERVCQMVSGLLTDIVERHAWEKCGAAGEWTAVA